jgi:hypothetical protein
MYYKLVQANVVCKELGYDGAKMALSNSHFGSVPRRFAFDDVHCNGNESALHKCSHLTDHDCQPGEAAGVVCHAAAAANESLIGKNHPSLAG